MPKIVAIGGGTGLSVILRGLKNITSELTAVVTVADDGGGSGVLREDLGMLPPGDIRNCILALANEEPVIQELFQYRFLEGRLKGQSFGNLMIAAMLGISGSIEEAIKRVSDIFAITGEVFPASNQPIRLGVRLENGSIVMGESQIPEVASRQQSKIEKIWSDPADAKSGEYVVEKILDADIITLGPGSLYTSIIPPLLIGNIVDAVNRSNAKIFYISNLMTQRGETDGFGAYEHVEALLRHTKLERIDCVLANTEPIDASYTQKYKEKNSVQSHLTGEGAEKIKAMGCELVTGNFASTRMGYIVHDAPEIADAIIGHFERKYVDSED